MQSVKTRNHIRKAPNQIKLNYNYRSRKPTSIYNRDFTDKIPFSQKLLEHEDEQIAA